MKWVIKRKKSLRWRKRNECGEWAYCKKFEWCKWTLSQYAIGLNWPELNLNAIFEFVNTENRFQFVYWTIFSWMAFWREFWINYYYFLFGFQRCFCFRLLSFACQAFRTNGIHLRRTNLLWMCRMCCAYMKRHYF